MNQYLDLINRIDTNINIIFRTARIRIEQTKTNKEALKIEEIYLPKIRTIFKAIVKQYDGGRLHLLHEAEKRYGLEIQTLIKSMVTRAYLLGIEYVSRATNREHLMYLSNGDVTNIMIRADESYRMFWRLVTKHLQVLQNKNADVRTAAVSHLKHAPNLTDVTITDEIFARQNEKDKRLLDPDTSAKLIGTGIVTSTLAFATLKKYRDLKSQQQILQSLKELESLDADNPLWTDLSYAKQQQILADYKRIIDEQVEQNNIINNRQPQPQPLQQLLTDTNKEDDEITGGLFDDDDDNDNINGSPERGDKVIFATEKDEKVCPTCSALEGEEWDIDDPTVVVPETDTHPHCRCRLLLKINGNIIAK